MTDGLSIQPNERILLLSIPELDVLRSISAQLDHGGVFCLGGREEVYAARKEASQLNNVLFHPGPPEEIPFDDECFTLVIDFKCVWESPSQVAREIVRVLSSVGRAALAVEDPGLFIAAGLAAREPAPPLLVFEKPEGRRPAPPPLTPPIAG